jgi:hypothetical protein
MIPPFEDNGWLPPGIHPATLDEIDARFGQLSELRRVQMESVRWLVELAVKAGAARIVLNGSFVADIMEPGDVDCVVLMGPNYLVDETADVELGCGLPFLQILAVGDKEFERLTSKTFATDRYGVAKGIVEIVL